MPTIHLSGLPHLSTAQQPVELVERKGIGHPDSMCDAIMEAISVALCQAYIDVAGRVLHHNIDKGLLVAGQSEPALGGGRVLAPMRLIIGDRATMEFEGHRIPVGEIAETTAQQWLAEHLRFVQPPHHLICQNELRPGSPELTDIFARARISANDTSAAVGYAPLSETEQCVLAAEHRLNDPALKAIFPEIGEDIKVMAYRQGRRLTLTIALAFVDRFIPNEHAYFDRKLAIRDELHPFLTAQLHDIDHLDLDINTLDEPGRGLGGMYLTVLGTSAEGGDGGQVGRGNRVNGVISLNRPAGNEAAAGKNPVSHVGKIYSLLSHQIAHHLYTLVDPVEEVYVWLCSQIGAPVEEPWVVAVQVRLAGSVEVADVEGVIKDIVQAELSDLPTFTDQLICGAWPVY
ncbi:MAG TPA: methionine adenosyltransferase [Candidatus Entotheonella sp.]